jgi:hypothetical protein
MAKLTIADLKFQIDLVAKELKAHNQRLMFLEVWYQDEHPDPKPPTKPVAFTKQEKLPRGKRATGS